MKKQIIKLPSQEYLNEFLEYNSENGELYWKFRDLKWFKTKRDCDAWNTRYAYKKTGYIHTLSKSVRVTVTIFHQQYLAHRVIFKMIYGYDPLIIDHINGNSTDNRLINLRSVDFKENARNTKKRSDGNNKFVGVCFKKNRKKEPWQADIGIGNRKTLRKFFATEEEAIICRKQWNKKFGYHENHGRIKNENQT